MLLDQLCSFSLQSFITFDNLPHTLLIPISSTKLLRQLLQIPQEILIDPVITNLRFEFIQFLSPIFKNCLLIPNLFEPLFITCSYILSLLSIALDFPIVTVDLLFLRVEIPRRGVLFFQKLLGLLGQTINGFAHIFFLALVFAFDFPLTLLDLQQFRIFRFALETY